MQKRDFFFEMFKVLQKRVEHQEVKGSVAHHPPPPPIVHGQACNVEEEQYSERVYTIREGETLELQCLVTGHPRPQIRWTKTAGGASDRPGNLSLNSGTLKIENISRHQGGRYYCKAENGLGFPAIRSIRVDVYYLDKPLITVHQSDDEAKEQFYFERTVFLRCAANSNPPVHYTWTRDREVLAEGSDSGVEIYKPFFTQGETKILKLKNLRLQDYADYTCIASVKTACGIRDRSTVFSLNNRTGPPSVKILLDDPVVANPGETITLVCKVISGHPLPALRWLRVNGEELPKRTIVKDGTLTVPVISDDDGGTYTCVASNNVGNPAKKSITILVRGLRKGRFWITPDPYHNEDKIQIGREVKISCQVEATPSDELQFNWLKNGRPLKSSERMVITHTDPNISPGTTNLDIIDLKFTDFGTYTCVASLRNGGIPEISIDVNISSTTGEALFGNILVCSLFCAAAEQSVLFCVSVTPTVEPVYTEVRQALGRAFSLTCNLLQAYPARHLQYEWKLGPRLLTVGQFSDQTHDTSYHVKALNREGYGEYTCDITNEAGAGRCTFLVTGKAYGPEFYYDTYNALWQNRPQVYGFKLQWTQMEPNAVDRILAYRLGIRQMGQIRWWEQEIPIGGAIQKGQLLTYNLTELVKPDSYLVRLTPITRYGEGDASERIITYSGCVCVCLGEFHCGFEEEALCSFSQDKSDEFDWTRHSGTTEGITSTPNTGPSSDHTGSNQGFYMFIETSSPRLEGDKARLMSPNFNILSKGVSSSASSNPTYCFTFYYHMYGRHIGALNIFLRQKGQTLTDTLVWSLTGNQGNNWRQARVNIHPTTAFQVVMEGVRGSNNEGNIAIDDVTIEEGECKDSPPNNLRSFASLPSCHVFLLYVTQSLVLIGWPR
uniref:MAM domain containing glycosylphosphatidylinositol anchor 2 n=1 Tax=Fundulus heteroclitus TaxID=8078 RepID=A0A3Q2QCN2_FUNHE